MLSAFCFAVFWLCASFYTGWLAFVTCTELGRPELKHFAIEMYSVTVILGVISLTSFLNGYTQLSILERLLSS